MTIHSRIVNRDGKDYIKPKKARSTVDVGGPKMCNKYGIQDVIDDE